MTSNPSSVQSPVICPVCEVEGRNSPLIRSPDGKISCGFFSSVGGSEAARHRAEVEKLLAIAYSCGPGFTSTMLDGRVTLSVQPHKRSHLIRATNCDRDLHIDNFDPTDAAKRKKFVSEIPGLTDEERTSVSNELLNLAGRAVATASVAETESSGAEIRVMSVVLSDGRSAEITSVGFAVYDPVTHSTTIQPRIEDADGKVFVPYVNQVEAEGIGLYLAAGVDEYQDETQLNEEITRFIEKYVDVTDQDRAIAAKYVLMSYKADALFEIPYLRAVGDSGNGKTRFTQAVGLLCCRPIFTVGITPAVLFRLNHLYKPTLIIDEFNLQSRGGDTESIIQMLNAGISRTNRVLRCSGDRANFAPEGFDPFGPKILAGLKGTDSQPFESRTYPVRLEQTKRNDITVQLTRSMLEEATVIRNKLTLWKLRTGGEDLSARLLQAESELKAAGGIRNRYIQVTIPLYALISDPDVQKKFIKQLQSRTIEYAEDKKTTGDGNLVDVIHSRLFVESESKGWVRVDFKDDLITEVEEKPDERLSVPAIVEDLNSRYPAKYPYTLTSVGKRLSGLGLHTKPIQR